MYELSSLCFGVASVFVWFVVLFCFEFYFIFVVFVWFGFIFSLCQL